MITLTIDELIDLCKKDDQRAQLELYNKYCDAMFNVSYRIVQDIYVAEDMMQEAFINAFKQLHTLKEPKIFGSWLKRIVINKSLNHLQKKSKEDWNRLDDVLYKIEDIQEDDSFDLTDHKVQEILKKINELKQNYRLLLNLHYVEGYDYEEISEITGMTYANCRTTMSRAKESLKKKLGIYV